MAITNTYNLMAMNAGKTLSVNNMTETQSAEKLTSDGKADQAKDIAASLEISERIRRQFGGANQSAQTGQKGTSLSQAADGALVKVDKMLHQINGLTMKAAEGASSASDRQAIQQEIHQLLNEISKIRDSAQLNKQYNFKGADADGGAAEMIGKVNGNILQQPAQSILTQANQHPDFVLQLLQ